MQASALPPGRALEACRYFAVRCSGRRDGSLDRSDRRLLRGVSLGLTPRQIPLPMAIAIPVPFGNIHMHSNINTHTNYRLAVVGEYRPLPAGHASSIP